jgi:hypothetical protein
VIDDEEYFAQVRLSAAVRDPGEQIDARVGPALAAPTCDIEQQAAVAAADLEDAQPGSLCRQRSAERAREDAARAHEDVDAAQVAARALRDGILGSEMVERLGLEDAGQHRVACTDRVSRRAGARRGS